MFFCDIIEGSNCYLRSVDSFPSCFFSIFFFFAAEFIPTTKSAEPGVLVPLAPLALLKTASGQSNETSLEIQHCSQLLLSLKSFLFLGCILLVLLAIVVYVEGWLLRSVEIDIIR